MKLFINSSRGDPRSTSYPFPKSISGLEDLREAASFDHVACEFRDGKNNRGRTIKSYRNNKCFVAADCVIMDCDNTTSDQTSFKTPADVHQAFPDVAFYVVYSRNHMKEKDGLAPRPRFHIYFPLSRMFTDLSSLESLKREILEYFPDFDPKAVSPIQMIFGVEDPKVEEYKGEKRIDEWVEKVIPEGERNSTLSAFAGKIITRLGDTEEAREEFDRVAERCTPRLEEKELETIWRSAQSFFHEKVEKDWKTPAEFDFDKKGFTLEDMERILHRIGVKIRMNDITGKMDIIGLKGVHKGDAANALPGEIRNYMNEKGIHCSRADMDDFIVNILARNHYNPIEVLLKSREWDGQDRVAELLEIMGIEDEMERTLVVKWLHQCITLALNDSDNPVAADGVLVLQGKQGIGKTLLCRKLAMKKDWFGEGASIDMGNKDTLIQATGHWIVELGELDSTLKKEQSSLKAFLTKEMDELRLPYAKAATMKPRRTSFCATVNPPRFLMDETGSRRFWVIKPNLDFERVAALDETWMRQMWTQVYSCLYKSNPYGFRLTREETIEVQRRNMEYTKPLAGETEILDTLNFDAPVEKWTWSTAVEVAGAIMSRNLGASHIGRVLTKLAEADPRIQIKRVNNTQQYLLPPKREYRVYPEEGSVF